MAMNGKSQDIAYFLSFCIEQYMVAKSLSGRETVELFRKYGVLEYLQDFFDVIHTQSRQWIIDDIDRFIKIREQEGK